MSPLPEPAYSLCEAIADIAALFAVAPYRSRNSRDACLLSIEWAEIFESRHGDREWDGEYVEVIEAFFKEKYAEWLISGADVVPNPYHTKPFPL